MWHTTAKIHGRHMLLSKTVVIGALVIAGVFFLATGVSGENSFGGLILCGISLSLALMIYRRSTPSE
jgi:hypothetical protein